MAHTKAYSHTSNSRTSVRLEEEVQPEDVAEALRLFKVSTMNTNASGQGSGGGAPSVMSAVAPSRDEMMRTESFLRSRLSVGAVVSVVNRQRILEEAAAQGYNSMVCARAISVMISRSEVQERNSGRLMKRKVIHIVPMMPMKLDLDNLDACKRVPSNSGVLGLHPRAQRYGEQHA